MCKCAANIKAIPMVIGQIGSPQKLIGSAANGYTFAYAPTIMLVGNVYHKYFCSTGTGPTAWDVIRHSTSLNLKDWTPPTVILSPSDPVNERSCCDPTTVRFNAGDGEFYYMYYSGNKTNVQTVNFVARCATPNGDFAKLTERGTWEVNAPDPKVIMFPFKASPEGSNIYGLGQPAVVAKGNTLYMWVSDNTKNAPSDYSPTVYMSMSTNAKDWSPLISTGVSAWSVDAKYDAAADSFVMFSGEDHHGATPKMMSRVSDDGAHWSDPVVLFDMPAYAHNVGVSGGERGELQLTKMLFAYGAPVDLVNNRSQAAWDLYGNIIDTVAGQPEVYRKASIAQASECIPALPASGITDNDPNTFYSSQQFPSKVVNRHVWLAAWFGGDPVSISKIVLKARAYGSTVMCFPEKYTLYVHLVGTTYWTSLGEFTTQPNSSGVATIDVGQREIYAVDIVPSLVGADTGGNYYFQLFEVGAI